MKAIISTTFCETKAPKDSPEPRDALEDTLESEVHIELEEAVNPKRSFTERPKIPKDFPKMESGIDPEEGRFVRDNADTGAVHELAEVTQNEKAFENMSSWVTLTTAERDNPAPEKTFNFVDDEEIHKVALEEDMEIRDAIDESNACDPILPTRVHMWDPEAGDIPVLTEVTVGTWKVASVDIEPQPNDEILTNRKIPTEDTILATNDESDLQIDCIDIECPIDAEADKLINQMLVHTTP